MFAKIQVVGGPLIVASDDEIDDAERQLGQRFPDGYRQFVRQFGEGSLAGWLRIYPPNRILSGMNNVAEWRERIDQYWFWDQGQTVLSKAAALECVIIGDTFDGDELVVHPTLPDRIYVLPRHSEDVFVAGDGLTAMVNWFQTAGILVAPFNDWTFQPFSTREQAS
jgi:SMI1 / KNR4 family (SUKH-1)